MGFVFLIYNNTYGKTPAFYLGLQLLVFGPCNFDIAGEGGKFNKVFFENLMDEMTLL